MNKTVVDKCPYCGGEELKDCRVDSCGGVCLNGGGLRSVALYALVCRDCGHVVSFYCKDPEKLYPKKERRK